MLSRYRATRACRSGSHELMQSFARCPPQCASRLLLHRDGRRLGSTVSGSKRRAALTLSRSTTAENTNGITARRWPTGRRLVSTSAPPGTELAKRRHDVYTLIDKINRHDDELADLLDDLYLLDDFDHILNTESWNLDDVFSGIIGHRDHQALEAKVRLARQQFGEILPEGHLNSMESKLYERLYGEAIIIPANPEETEEKEPDMLLRDDGQGGLEEVEVERIETQDADMSGVYDVESDPSLGETATIERAREIAEELGGELLTEEQAEDIDPESVSRLHPLTEAGKFSTEPSTVFLPLDTMTAPIQAILHNFSNRHVAEAAHKSFGGRHLPHSTTTLPPRAQVPQLPIPLTASQHHMGEMEANAYIAALYPGIYASALSVLVEVRKRLGTDWIRRLIKQENGPRVLDAGGGGAGILAWRDVVRAEYETMVPDYPENAPIPTGKSTVLAGSETLQRRASVMLENTTFLPRLPDYVHVRDTTTLEDDRAPPKRKQFDVIIAPHTILQIEEDYMRKQHVRNLWSMLDPNGGVLILLEKGRQRGFEAIAGAREMLLERHIASPGATEYESPTESGDDGVVEKEEGMIIAPCTNHGNCPMYHIHGQSKGRSDYCRFEQRYIRPPFLQRIVGAKDRNHEDVEFSYVAVQRGVDLRQTDGFVQGKAATEAAFEGYEELFDQAVGSAAEPATSAASNRTGDGRSAPTSFNALSLPRTVLPPIKRRGHVIFDLCTPESKIERWTVPRSFSKQAYRDARKAQWGDLWALGAKTRIPRNLKLGTAKSQDSKKERLERRSASKRDQMDEEEGDDLVVEGEGNTIDLSVISALAEQADSFKKKKTGKTIPSWKRHVDKKRIRQASRKASAERSLENVA